MLFQSTFVFICIQQESYYNYISFLEDFPSQLQHLYETTFFFHRGLLYHQVIAIFLLYHSKTQSLAQAPEAVAFCNPVTLRTLLVEL